MEEKRKEKNNKTLVVKRYDGRENYKVIGQDFLAHFLHNFICVFRDEPNEEEFQTTMRKE
jgi:hypothetical protein